MTDEVKPEQVQNPDGLLAAYNNLKEDIRKITAERESLTKELADLKESAGKDEWRAKALVAETKAALTSQGLKNADALMKYIGTEGLDFDDEGKVTGLDERLKELRTDLPEVFDPKRRAGGKADIFETNPAEAKVDPLKQAVHAALHG